METSLHSYVSTFKISALVNVETINVSTFSSLSIDPELKGCFHI